MLQIKIINTEVDLYQIKDEWNELLMKSKFKTPFLTWQWVYTWWEVLKKEHEKLFILHITDDFGELVALAPFYLKKEKIFHINLTTIEFIGADERASADYLDIIISPNFFDAVIKRIVDFLKKEKAYLWDVIIMKGILKNSAAFKISQSLSSEGYHVFQELFSVCPYIILPRTWEEYLDTLSKKSRYNTRKKRKTLDAAHSTRFYIVNDSHVLKAAMDNTIQLHKKRMLMKGTTGFSMTKDFEAFHYKVAEQFSKNGWLCLGILEANGSPVACQYGFRFDKKFLHYQTGLNPDYAMFSVGLVSTGLMIENAIKEGFEEYDFLRGHEDYKFHWAKTERRIFSSYVLNKTYKGHLFFFKKRIIVKARKIAKSLFNQISYGH